MKSQRGNVIVYALVGLVLFGVLAGSIYWVRQRSTPAPVATNNQTQEQTKTEVKQDENPAQSAEKPAAGNSETQTPSGPGTSSGTGSSNPVQSNRDTTNPSKPESQTPRTGPSPAAVAASGPLENSLISSIVLGTATFAGTSYVRSRRSHI
ncbi:MAG: hypothetical protein ABIQ64_02580 [Candidatus Saccharimonadales bacterium]